MLLSFKNALRLLDTIVSMFGASLFAITLARIFATLAYWSVVLGRLSVLSFGQQGNVLLCRVNSNGALLD